MLQRQAFIESMGHMLPADGVLALLMVKLKRVDDINAAYGFRAGDRYIDGVGARISGALRDVDIVSRFGDNEFGVLLPGLRNSAHATLAANKILSELNHPVEFDDITISPRVVIGIAISCDNDHSAYDLLQKAGLALNDAESTKRNYSLYSRQTSPALPPGIVLERAIRNAYENDQLDLYFQPQIDFESRSLVGAEALLRWFSPLHRNVSTQTFVNVLEHMDILVDITQWVLNTAVRQCCEFAGSRNDFSIAVNLSPKLLAQPSIVDLVSSTVNIWGLDPSRLILEVTEGAMMLDPAESMKILNRFTEKGMNISIDDFGTGYSSLSYLKDLPIRELKIDKSFVMNMTRNRKDRSIVRATIDLAHALGLSVVAEGIEDADIYKALIGMGCDRGQGYYIGHPMPVTQFYRWLQEPHEYKHTKF